MCIRMQKKTKSAVMNARNHVSYKLRSGIHRSLEEIDYNRVEALPERRETSEGLLYDPISILLRSPVG